MGLNPGFTNLIVMALFRITPELVDGAISPVIMVVAFASAVLGSILAPLIQAVMNAVADVRIPTFEDFDFPQFPRIKRRRKNDILKKGNTICFHIKKSLL